MKCIHSSMVGGRHPIILALPRFIGSASFSEIIDSSARLPAQTCLTSGCKVVAPSFLSLIAFMRLATWSSLALTVTSSQKIIPGKSWKTLTYRNGL